MSRNLVRGFGAGIRVTDVAGLTRLDNDVIDAPSDGVGIKLSDTGGDDPNVSDAKATNLSIVGDGEWLGGTQASLTLDSSIVDTAGGASGTDCTITFSRGNTKTPGGDGCSHFQTKADPKFGADGYHLKSSSPMIDKGAPAKPPKGSKDIDGGKRALDGPDGGDCHGKPRRDMGADEFKC